FGTSTSVDRMQNGWWRGGSVSTLTEYGMTLPAIEVGPTIPPEMFLPLLTRNQVECGPVRAVCGFLPGCEGQQSLRTNEADDACDGGRWGEVFWRPPGGDHASCSDQRAGRGGRRFRTLVDGRTTSLHSRVDS